MSSLCIYDNLFIRRMKELAHAPCALAYKESVGVASLPNVGGLRTIKASCGVKSESINSAIDL